MSEETKELTFEELSKLESGTILVDDYENGVRYLIMRGPCSLCAYVGVPSDHPLAGKDYDDVPLDCHYGLTFSGEGGDEDFRPAGWYWYGWDYGHSGDKAFYDVDRDIFRGDTEWTVAMVKQEIWSVTYEFAKLKKLMEAK